MGKKNILLCCFNNTKLRVLLENKGHNVEAINGFKDAKRKIGNFGTVGRPDLIVIGDTLRFNLSRPATATGLHLEADGIKKLQKVCSDVYYPKNSIIKFTKDKAPEDIFNEIDSILNSNKDYGYLYGNRGYVHGTI